MERVQNHNKTEVAQETPQDATEIFFGKARTQTPDTCNLEGNCAREVSFTFVYYGSKRTIYYTLRKSQGEMWGHL